MKTKTTIALLVALAACGAKKNDATPPQPDQTPPPTAPAPEPGMFGAPMVGGGSVKVHSKANDTFSAEITVTLEKATPSTTYTIQRAPEIGRPNATDKVCQRANSQFPWEQPNSKDFPAAPAYVTFELPPGSSAPGPVTIMTDAAGNGTTTFKFDAPMIKRGAAFDVQFRAIDLAGKGKPVVSECFQVTPQ